MRLGTLVAIICSLMLFAILVFGKCYKTEVLVRNPKTGECMLAKCVPDGYEVVRSCELKPIFHPSQKKIVERIELIRNSTSERENNEGIGILPYVVGGIIAILGIWRLRSRLLPLALFLLFVPLASASPAILLSYEYDTTIVTNTTNVTLIQELYEKARVANLTALVNETVDAFIVSIDNCVGSFENTTLIENSTSPEYFSFTNNTTAIKYPHSVPKRIGCEVRFKFYVRVNGTWYESSVESFETIPVNLIHVGKTYISPQIALGEMDDAVIIFYDTERGKVIMQYVRPFLDMNVLDERVLVSMDAPTETWKFCGDVRYHDGKFYILAKNVLYVYDPHYFELRTVHTFSGHWRGMDVFFDDVGRWHAILLEKTYYESYTTYPPLRYWYIWKSLVWHCYPMDSGVLCEPRVAVDSTEEGKKFEDKHQTLHYGFNTEKLYTPPDGLAMKDFIDTGYYDPYRECDYYEANFTFSSRAQSFTIAVNVLGVSCPAECWVDYYFIDSETGKTLISGSFFAGKCWWKDGAWRRIKGYRTIVKDVTSLAGKKITVRLCLPSACSWGWAKGGEDWFRYYFLLGKPGRVYIVARNMNFPPAYEGAQPETLWFYDERTKYLHYRTEIKSGTNERYWVKVYTEDLWNYGWEDPILMVPMYVDQCGVYEGYVEFFHIDRNVFGYTEGYIMDRAYTECVVANGTKECYCVRGLVPVVKRLYPVDFYTTYFDWDSRYEKSLEDVRITVCVPGEECTTCFTNEEGYCRILTYSPTEPVKVRVSSVKIPRYQEFDLSTITMPWTVELRFEDDRLNTTISVMDDRTFQPIEGVEVTVDGETKYTDTEGKVTFLLEPLLSGEFELLIDETKGYAEGKVKAKLRNFHVTLTKENYERKTETFALAELTDSYVDHATIKRTVRFYLSKHKAIVGIRTYTLDGYELTLVSAKVYVEGIEDVYLFRDEKLTKTKVAQGTPATFYVYELDKPVNFTVSFFGNYTKTIVPRAGEYYALDFILNETLEKQHCKVLGDCRPSTCVGRYYWKTVGCVDNYCKYEITFCRVGCDPLIGCFDEATTIPCETDYDCPTYCKTDRLLLHGKCGSFGYCYYVHELCEFKCDNVTKSCVPREAGVTGEAISKGVSFLTTTITMGLGIAPELAKSFIWQLVTVILVAVVAYKTRNWQLSVVLLLVMMVVGALIGWMPSWIVLVLIVIAGVAVAWAIRGGFYGT